MVITKVKLLDIGLLVRAIMIGYGIIGKSYNPTFVGQVTPCIIGGELKYSKFEIKFKFLLFNKQIVLVFLRSR